MDRVVQGRDFEGGAGFGFETAGFFERGQFALEDEWKIFAGMSFAPFAMVAIDTGFVEGEFGPVNAEDTEDTVAALVGSEGEIFRDFFGGVIGILLEQIRSAILL